jgi:hypothetical protein
MSRMSGRRNGARRYLSTCPSLPVVSRARFYRVIVVTASWVAAHAGFPAKAAAFFGPGIKLSAITPERVTEFIAWLRRQARPQGGTYSEQSVRHHLYALSALYRKAQHA